MGWEGRGTHLALLRQVGVFDGLRLLNVPQGPWSYGFDAVKGYFSLPDDVPPGMSSREWAEYCGAVRDERQRQTTTKVRMLSMDCTCCRASTSTTISTSPLALCFLRRSSRV